MAEELIKETEEKPVEKKTLKFWAGLAVGLGLGVTGTVSVDQTTLEQKYAETKAAYEVRAEKRTKAEVFVAAHDTTIIDKITVVDSSKGIADTTRKTVSLPDQTKRIYDKWNPGKTFLTKAGRSYRVTFSDAETDSVYFNGLYFPGDSCTPVIKPQFPHIGKTFDTTDAGGI